MLYALVMLVGIWVLLKGFTGVARKWWMAALVIQFWHHIEHLLLITQATLHHNFWGRPVPFSVLQLVIPRVELHLFYNTIVFIPMVIAMYYHMFPPAEETDRAAMHVCLASAHGRGPRLLIKASSARLGTRVVAVRAVLACLAVLPATACRKSPEASPAIVIQHEITPWPARVGPAIVTVQTREPPKARQSPALAFCWRRTCHMRA